MDRGAWWAAVHGVAKSWTQLSDFTFIFYLHTLEKEMATHSSVLTWGIPGTGEPGGLPSMGSHRVRHDWSNLAVAVAAAEGIFGYLVKAWKLKIHQTQILLRKYPLSIDWYWLNINCLWLITFLTTHRLAVSEHYPSLFYCHFILHDLIENLNQIWWTQFKHLNISSFNLGCN